IAEEACGEHRRDPFGQGQSFVEILLRFCAERLLDRRSIEACVEARIRYDGAGSDALVCLVFQNAALCEKKLYVSFRFAASHRRYENRELDQLFEIVPTNLGPLARQFGKSLSHGVPD